MKYDLSKEDIKLILKALDGIRLGALMNVLRSEQEMAIEQRVQQIRDKLK